MSNETRQQTPAEIADRTRAYVRENFLYMRPEWPLKDEDPLFGGGAIARFLAAKCHGAGVRAA